MTVPFMEIWLTHLGGDVQNDMRFKIIEALETILTAGGLTRQEEAAYRYKAGILQADLNRNNTDADLAARGLDNLLFYLEVAGPVDTDEVQRARWEAGNIASELVSVGRKLEEKLDIVIEALTQLIESPNPISDQSMFMACFSFGVICDARFEQDPDNVPIARMTASILALASDRYCEGQAEQNVAVLRTNACAAAKRLFSLSGERELLEAAFAKMDEAVAIFERDRPSSAEFAMNVRYHAERALSGEPDEGAPNGSE